MRYEIAERLKRKRKWSGEEIARAQIANNAYRIEKQLPGEAGLLFSPEKLQKHVDALFDSNDETEITRYRVFMLIFDWIMDRNANALGHVQQAQLCVIRLESWSDIGQAIQKTYLNMVAPTWGDLRGTSWNKVSLKTWDEICAPLEEYSLTALFPDTPDGRLNRERLLERRAALYTSYDFITAYNIAIDIIVKEFNLEDVEVHKLPMDLLDMHFSDYNKSIKQLRDLVEKDPYKELRTKKLEVLDSILTPLEEHRRPTKDQIEKATAAAKTVLPFYQHAPFLEYLTGRAE